MGKIGHVHVNWEGFMRLDYKFHHIKIDSPVSMEQSDQGFYYLESIKQFDEGLCLLNTIALRKAYPQ